MLKIMQGSIICIDALRLSLKNHDFVKICQNQNPRIKTYEKHVIDANKP